MRLTKEQQAKYDNLVNSGMSYKLAQSIILDDEPPETTSSKGVDPSPEKEVKAPSKASDEG